MLGLLTGGVFALMASGLTLIFGIMKVINLAQGAMVILGAYLGYQLFAPSASTRSCRSCCAAAMFLLGVGLQLVSCARCAATTAWSCAARHLRGRAAIEGVMSLVWKTTYRGINTGYANDCWTVARLPDHECPAVGVRACRSSCSGCCSRAAPHPLRAGDPRDRAEPRAAQLLGVEAEPGVGDRVRHRRRRPRRRPARSTACSTRSTRAATTT